MDPRFTFSVLFLSRFATPSNIGTPTGFILGYPAILGGARAFAGLRG